MTYVDVNMELGKKASQRMTLHRKVAVQALH